MADNGQNGETTTYTAPKARSEDGRKIFVGGLSWETTVEEMKSYFEKYGTVSDCTLKTDPTSGRSRGFGFVLFEEASSVKTVLAEGSHSLNGRNIDPKPAKAKPGQEPIRKVFVGGLDPSVPEADIREHFAKFGEIEELSLPFDKVKGQRRAFCFITYATEEAVDELVRAPKQTVGGKEVDVKKATPKEDQGGFGGRGGGRGGFGGGRGRGRGGYNQGGDWNQGYDSYGGGYDQGYGGQGYGGYDYSGAYDYSGYNSGYGSQGYGSYGAYDYSGQGYGAGGYGSGGGYGGGKQAGGYGQRRGGGGYHPYSR